MKIKLIINAVFDAAKSTVKHDGLEFAGYLSYLFLLSLFPFLFICTAILGHFVLFIFDEVKYKNITHEVVLFLEKVFPQNIISGIMPFIQEVLSGPTHSLLTLAIISAIWTSSSTLEGMRTIFNRAYRVEFRDSYFFGRMISIVQILIITAISTSLLIIYALIPSTIINIDTDGMYFYAFIILVLITSWMYLMIPNIKNNVRNVLPGAVVVSFLWIICTELFSLYIETFTGVSMIYGSLSGIIVAMIFFYIMNICLIFGAELNYSLNNFNKI